MRGKKLGVRNRAIFVVAFCAILMALPIGNAFALNTVSLRPNVDIGFPATGDWAIVGATTYWDALDDGIDQPQIPTSSNYIKHLTKKGRPQVGLTTTPLLGRDVLSAKAWFYAPTSKQVTAAVMNGETVLASREARSPGWHSVPFTLNGTQSQLDNLSLKFEASSEAGGEVYAAYVALQLQDHPKVYWGAWMNGDIYGPGFTDAPWDEDTWETFENHAGKSLSLVHFGQPPPWIQPKFEPTPFDLTYKKGAIPLVDMANDLAHFPIHVSLREIDEGKVDAAWTSWAKEVAAYGKPFFLRWDWEMNGDWFPYGKEMQKINSESPAVEDKRLFTRVWERLWNLSMAAGAKNITWVWCPNVIYPGSGDLGYLNPGSPYVDWNCIDGYNRGGSSWQTFSQVFSATYNQLDNKPIMIAETASSEFGGSKAAWIKDTLETQIPINFPKIRAIAWFNWNVKGDWVIESSPSATASFASAISSPFYAPGEFGSLPPLTKIQPLP
jgi:hypothetical protein